MKSNVRLFINYLILSFVLNAPSNLFCRAAITYNFSGGRFGDNLLAYLHAKWLSTKYDLPFVYKPFPYSDQLTMHAAEKQSNPRSKEIVLKNIVNLMPNEDTLYIVPYFPELPYDEHYRCNFLTEWDNKVFRAEIKKLTRPLPNIETVEIPAGVISVAVHVRQNEEKRIVNLTGKVPPAIQHHEGYTDYNDILKFPPDSFYIEQLKILANFFRGKKLYVFIFTDLNPVELKKRFCTALADFTNIVFDCRNSELIGRNNLVLEDFFSLQKFDCLIRPQSNFSLVAAKLANYLIEISPLFGYWEYRDNRWIPHITKVEIVLANDFRLES